MARRQDKKALLLQRVTDIYSGADGDSWDGVHEDDQYASPTTLSRVIPALRGTFGELYPNWWVYGISELNKFEKATTATEHLWENGVRPDKVLKPAEEE